MKYDHIEPKHSYIVIIGRKGAPKDSRNRNGKRRSSHYGEGYSSQPLSIIKRQVSAPQ